MPQTDDLKTLATAAHYLSEHAKGETWHLSCRKAAELIGKSHTTGNTCLRILQRAGVIQLTRESYLEIETDDLTGEQKRVRYAAEFRYALDVETANFTQATQAIQTTHHHQEVQPKSGPLPITETITAQEQKLGGGVATLPGIPQPKPTGNLGTPEDVIAMAVTDTKPGPLGVLPKQETIPEPPSTNTTAL